MPSSEGRRRQSPGRDQDAVLRVRNKLVATNVTPLEQHAFYKSCESVGCKPADLLRSAMFAFQAVPDVRKALLKYLNDGCVSVIGS